MLLILILPLFICYSACQIYLICAVSVNVGTDIVTFVLSIASAPIHEVVAELLSLTSNPLLQLADPAAVDARQGVDAPPLRQTPGAIVPAFRVGLGAQAPAAASHRVA